MTYDPQRPPGGAGAGPGNVSGNTPGNPDDVDDLQFDRAETAPPPPSAPTATGLGERIPATSAPPTAGAPGVTVCAACHEPIADVYFEGNGKVVCPRCRDAVMAAQNAGSPAARFFRASLFGLGAGAVGAAIWYGITVASKGSIYGIVAIVLGLMVGAAVRAGSGRKGGVGYQLLAVAITYLAIAASLAVYAIRDLREQGTHISSSPAGVIILAVFALAAPVIIGFTSPLTLVIIGIALWEAWRLNKPSRIHFNGPYRLGGGATPAPVGFGAFPPAPSPYGPPPPPPMGRA